jgi:hypothetical protein
MKRFYAVILALAIALVTSASLALPADASSKQKICNDKYSQANIVVGTKVVKPGHCTKAKKGTTISQAGRSYVVSYNHWKTQSECRANNHFHAWKKAKRADFGVYDEYGCDTI